MSGIQKVPESVVVALSHPSAPKNLIPPCETNMHGVVGGVGGTCSHSAKQHVRLATKGKAEFALQRVHSPKSSKVQRRKEEGMG